MIRVVAAPEILGAALRSAGGASNALLRQAAYRRISFLVSAPLLLEYEAELKSPEQRLAHGRLIEAVDRFLAAVASASEYVSVPRITPVRSSDPIDAMMLQVGLAGAADAIVTLNPSRFGKVAEIRACRPDQFLKEI